MHLGNIEIWYLDGGAFGLDGGAMFGVVPKVLWEKKSPPDEKNRIRMRANSLLVRAHNKNILIETGNGTKWDAKQRAIYKVDGVRTLNETYYSLMGRGLMGLDYAFRRRNATAQFWRFRRWPTTTGRPHRSQRYAIWYDGFRRCYWERWRHGLLDHAVGHRSGSVQLRRARGRLARSPPGARA